jgi:hypothetical protein
MCLFGIVGLLFALLLTLVLAFGPFAIVSIATVIDIAVAHGARRTLAVRNRRTATTTILLAHLSSLHKALDFLVFSARLRTLSTYNFVLVWLFIVWRLEALLLWVDAVVVAGHISHPFRFSAEAMAERAERTALQ